MTGRPHESRGFPRPAGGEAALATQRETRFADLLADHPDAEAELAAIYAEEVRVYPVFPGHEFQPRTTNDQPE